MSTYNPLEGVKVVELTAHVAGPSAGGILSRFGADVIWVESPKTLNACRALRAADIYCQGKRSIALDLKSPEGKEAFFRLLKDADIFIHNIRQGAADRLGLSWEALHAFKPSLVYGAISGWGHNGPMKDAPGVDTTAFWARSGMALDLAEKGSICVVPPAVGDNAAASTLVAGMLAALYKAQKTGEGAMVDTSLVGTAYYVYCDPIYEVQHGLKYQQTRTKPRRALLNSYHCKDGWFMICTVEFEKHFNKILKIIGREDLIGDPRWTCIEDTMMDKSGEITAILDEGFAKMTKKEAVEALQACDITAEIAQSTLDASGDEQAIANGYLVDFKDEKDGKTYKLSNFPVHFNEEGSAPYAPLVKQGENSVEILKSIGYSDAEIQNMLDKKITATHL